MYSETQTTASSDGIQMSPRKDPAAPATAQPKVPLTEQEREKIEKKEQRNDCCKRALRFSLSQVGLLLVVILYAVAGGFIFQHLESTNEKEQCVQGRDKYEPMENETIYKIWSISSSFRLNDDAPYAMAAYRTQLSKFRDEILSLGYNGNNCTAMGEPDGPPYQWSYPGALLFATTIFTTVGTYSLKYGLIHPRGTSRGIVFIIFIFRFLEGDLKLEAEDSEGTATIFVQELRICEIQEVNQSILSIN